MPNDPKEPKKTTREPGATARKRAAAKRPAPKPRSRPKRQVTQDMIERRAYELFQSGAGGDMLAHCELVGSA
jgi:hypothetical protein